MLNILVTGASRGIGLEIVKVALEQGHQVMAIARHESTELKTLSSSFSLLKFKSVDLSSPTADEDCRKAVDAWQQVDVFFNNAGVYAKEDTREDFQTSFLINTIAPFLFIKALLPKLKAAKNPQVICTSSQMGSISQNSSGGAYAYRSSKAALNMLVRGLSNEEAWLTVIAIHPGWVQTEMGGENATLTVEESVRGIWKVAVGLSRKQSGQFFDYSGKSLPW